MVSAGMESEGSCWSLCWPRPSSRDTGVREKGIDTAVSDVLPQHMQAPRTVPRHNSPGNDDRGNRSSRSRAQAQGRDP